MHTCSLNISELKKTINHKHLRVFGRRNGMVNLLEKVI